MATRCSDSKPLAELPLPILEERRSAIRKSKNGPRRAIVLLLVHVVIAVHVGHWWATGTTLSPLEPSEAMQFSQASIVNAGLIFFALAIASTLVLGRWFCGWGCHVVALQDASRWLLGKAGIRPRAVNLGILAAVPWIAFTYMFLAPVAQRLLHGFDVGPQVVELTTHAFWKTFPTWPVAVVTFLVCGFAIVYLLGAKGFCTYGCPYGGIFGLVDQLAPMRVRVTDACDACGHCTAVCSSNVRVHEEVRDYGAVVDAGCMKCLDCVSVCPMDALYVGFGAPAVATKRRAGARTAPPEPLPSILADLALLGAFFAGSYAVMLGYDEDLARIPDAGLLIAVLAALSLAVAAVFRGKARRKREYSRLEEVLLGGTFLLALYTFRGYRDAVPLLFALGLSAILAFLAVQGLRLLVRSDVRVQRHVLRSRGRWTGHGVAYAAILLPITGLWGFLGWSRHELRTAYASGIAEAEAGRFDTAILELQRAVDVDAGYRDAQSKLGSLLCDVGRLDEGISAFEAVVARNPDAVEAHALLGLALFQRGEGKRAREELERAVELAPGNPNLLSMLAEICQSQGDTAAAEEHRAAAQRAAAGPPPH